MTRPSDPSYNHTIGEVPIVNESIVEVNGSQVITGEDYYIVAVCPLLMSSFPKGILKNVPDGYVHPRNCFPDGANAQPNVTDCLNKCNGSYAWLTTINGDVSSICIGDECQAHGEDGDQTYRSPPPVRNTMEFCLVVWIIAAPIIWIMLRLIIVFRKRRT